MASAEMNKNNVTYITYFDLPEKIEVFRLSEFKKDAYYATVQSPGTGNWPNEKHYTSGRIVLVGTYSGMIRNGGGYHDYAECYEVFKYNGQTHAVKLKDETCFVEISEDQIDAFTTEPHDYSHRNSKIHIVKTT